MEGATPEGTMTRLCQSLPQPWESLRQPQKEKKKEKNESEGVDHVSFPHCGAVGMKRTSHWHRREILHVLVHAVMSGPDT